MQGSNNTFSFLISTPLAENIRIELRKAARISRTSLGRSYGGGGFAARRSYRIYKYYLAFTFVLVAFLPSVAFSTYMFLLPDRFKTASRFVIASEVAAPRGMLPTLLSKGDASEGDLVSYLESNNIILDLKAHAPSLLKQSGVVSEHYMFFRRPTNSIEEELVVWKQNVSINRLPFISTMELAVSARTADSSLQLHNTILDLAERHINELSSRKQARQIEELTTGVDNSREALIKMLSELEAVRSTNRIIDPASESRQRLALIYELERQQAELRQRRDVLQQRGSKGPQIEDLTAQINVIESIKNDARAAFAGTDRNGSSLPVAFSEIVMAEVNVDIARRDLARKTLQLFEARQLAGRQERFIQKSVSPVLPSRPQPMNRLAYSALFIAGAVCTWLFLAAVGAVVRDHAR